MKQPAERRNYPRSNAALLCAFSVTQALAARVGKSAGIPHKVVASTLLSEFKIVCLLLSEGNFNLKRNRPKRALQCTAASVATAAVPGVAYGSEQFELYFVYV